jgi:C1A family cysteine protease
MTYKHLAIIVCLPLLTMLSLPHKNGIRKNALVKTGTVSSIHSAPSDDDGNGLDVSIVDTNNYRTYTTGPLPWAFRLEMPTPGDQGKQGSCAAWATVYGAGNYYIHLTRRRPYSDTGNLSPRFTYNQLSKGRCGCSLVLDNLYLLKTQGACSLSAMPYTDSDCSAQPDSLQRTNAEKYKIKGWAKIDPYNLALVKRALSEKKPVIFSMATDEGFDKITAPFIWKARSGAVEQPHSMVLAGYDDGKNAFLAMNSWGTAWGDNGFIWIDYRFFLDNVLPLSYILI